jgi:hypothetical protein
MASKKALYLCDAGVDQILCDMAGVPSLREWRILPEETRNTIRPKMEIMIRDIDARNPEAIRLRDVHFVFSRANGERGLRAVQPWDKEILVGIAVAIANPAEIIRRRMKDITLRPDRKCDIELVAEEQNMELTVAGQQSVEIGVPFRIVENETPNVDKSCEELFNFCISVATAK